VKGHNDRIGSNSFVILQIRNGRELFQGADLGKNTCFGQRFSDGGEVTCFCRHRGSSWGREIERGVAFRKKGRTRPGTAKGKSGLPPSPGAVDGEGGAGFLGERIIGGKVNSLRGKKNSSKITFGKSEKCN